MKWLKRIGIFLLVIIGILAILFFVFNEPKPEGQSGSAADALANKMLNAIDKTAWDTTTYVQWNFMGMHSFLWDKKRHFVKVNWDDNEVLLDTKKVAGKAFQDGIEQIGPAADELIQNAWSFFCNDSFWLNAPAKAFDPGTERSIVTQEDGNEALLVTYASGGVTPGDSYLWVLDENGLPKSWKMWVKIIPIGGTEATWEKYTTLSTGAKISTLHNGLIELNITDLKGATDLAGMGLTEDPFTGL